MLYTPSPPLGSDPATRLDIMREISEHSQIISVADATARNALVAGLSPTPSQPVWVWRRDTLMIEVTTNGTDWVRWTQGAGGRVAKTDGFQSLGSGAFVTLADDWRNNGVGYSTANGGGLSVSVSGGYRVTMTAYWSGGSGVATVNLVRRRAGTNLDIGRISQLKPSSDDVTQTRSDDYYLNAGDSLHLYAVAPMSIWGDSDRLGTSLSISAI